MNPLLFALVLGGKYFPSQSLTQTDNEDSEIHNQKCENINETVSSVHLH